MNRPLRSTISLASGPGTSAGHAHGALRWILGLLLSTVVVAGCSKSGSETTEADKPGTAHTQVDRGPVRVRVVADPSPARLSDLVKLTITIDYEHGVTVRKPSFGDMMGEFAVRGYPAPLLRTQGDRDIIQQVYELEPMRTGKLAVLPITVSFTDTRPGGDGKEHTVETEGLTVEVSSVAADEVPKLESLRPAAGPVELPRSGTGVMIAIGVALLMAVAVAVFWWVMTRRKAAAVVPELSPRDLAYLELERLMESGLAATDVKLYYVELTAIVRRYIERTTGIRAPEQTTQEFLHEIGRKAVFDGADGRRLGQFLESADLVKFAAHHPRREDIEESFRRAQAFVGFQVSEEAA